MSTVNIEVILDRSEYQVTKRTPANPTYARKDEDPAGTLAALDEAVRDIKAAIEAGEAKR